MPSSNHRIAGHYTSKSCHNIIFKGHKSSENLSGERYIGICRVGGPTGLSRFARLHRSDRSTPKGSRAFLYVIEMCYNDYFQHDLTARRQDVVLQ